MYILNMEDIPNKKFVEDVSTLKKVLPWLQGNQEGQFVMDFFQMVLKICYNENRIRIALI